MAQPSSHLSDSAPPSLGWLCSFVVLVALLGGCSSAEASEEGPDAPPASVDGPLDLDDVSILFPLPKSLSNDGLLAASASVGANRELLPRSLATRLPLLQEDPRATYDSLHVVSVRLDPCFREAGARQDACKRQVRFVLQPLALSEKGEVSTIDAAAHVFYELPNEPFVALLRGLLEARPRPARGPLGVHRTLAQQGLEGPFARILKDRLTVAAASASLVRVTFMSLRGRGNEWQFGGFRVTADGTVSPLGVVPSRANVQSLVLQTTDSAFVKSIAPAIADSALAPLLDTTTLRAATPEAREEALRAANRIENPAFRSSEDTDCASCHTTSSSKHWAERVLSVRSSVDQFESPTFDLSVSETPASDLAVLRAFGYVGGAPFASPRTIHESAAAARISNGLLAEK